jgi:probable F420-dependent oxidoreductase
MIVQISRIGVWLGPLALLPAAEEREAVQELEELGYGAFWFGEGPGTREALVHAATLLSWTTRAVVVSGVANIYVRDPMAMANGARALADAFPGRFLLGVGVSHAPTVADRGHSYGPPIETMRDYLDGMETCLYRPPEPASPAGVILAALGPRMLRLAAERTSGAHPYFTPPAHTVVAREVLGRDRLLAPEQGFLLEGDPDEARRLARLHASYYLRLDNYRRSMLRLGFTEDDVAGDGSDRLVDAIVSWGDPEAVRDRVRAHLEAGADHVCVQAVGPEPLEALRRLAPAVCGL